MTPKTVLIIATAAIAALLEIIDSSIVNVAIPTMMGNLGVTQDEISWVSTGYMIANSIVLPIAAWLGTRLGRRRYFTGAILCFTAASFACGLAPSLFLLVFFRIIQGLAGGALLPTAQTLIQEQFPPSQAGMAMAFFGMSVMIGPALGPTLGGYLTDNLGWRSIFNINVPIGLIAAILSYMNVQDQPKVSGSSTSGTKSRVDLIGLMLLCVGVGCFQYILERGQSDDWLASSTIRTCAVLAILGLGAFVYWELRISNPIMNLRLFRHNAVSAGTLLMMALGVMVYALTFEVPIFANTVQKLTATQTGILFMPGSILTIGAMLFVGKTMNRVGPKYYVLFGLLLGECTLFVMSRFTVQTASQELYLPLILRSVGTGFLFIPINAMVLGKFRGPELGQVAGMMNFFRQIGGSIGIASLDVLMTRFSAQNYVELQAHVNALNPVAYHQWLSNQNINLSKLSGSVGLGSAELRATKALFGKTLEQVFILSFSQLCICLMGLIALGLIPLYLLKVGRSVKVVMDAH